MNQSIENMSNYLEDAWSRWYDVQASAHRILNGVTTSILLAGGNFPMSELRRADGNLVRVPTEANLSNDIIANVHPLDDLNGHVIAGTPEPVSDRNLPDRQRFGRGIRARIMPTNESRLQLNVNVLAVGAGNTALSGGTWTNRYAIGANAIQWNEWNSFVSFTAEATSEPSSLLNSDWTNELDRQSLIAVRRAGRRLFRHTHFNPAYPARAAIARMGSTDTNMMNRFNTDMTLAPPPAIANAIEDGHSFSIERNWRQTAPIIRTFDVSIPADMYPTWVRIRLGTLQRGQNSYFPAEYVYFPFPARVYRPMATRVGNEWHSLNRENGFLESRANSGWEELSLLLHSNAPNMDATNNADGDTPFPAEASSQSRGGSGSVWRQQSLIGSE